MDYYGDTMGNSQNSMPESLESAKLSPSPQRNDTQSVTKRFVFSPTTTATFTRTSSSDLFKIASY